MQDEVTFILRWLHEKNPSSSTIFEAAFLTDDPDLCEISGEFAESFPQTALKPLLAKMAVSMGLIEIQDSGWYLLPTVYYSLTPEKAAEIIVREMKSLNEDRARIRSSSFAALGPYWGNRLLSLRVPELLQADLVGPTIAEVIAQNPKVVDQIKAGKTQALGFLIGQVLKRVKANPASIRMQVAAALGLEDS